MSERGTVVADIDGLGGDVTTSEADAGDAAVLVRRMANRHGCSRVRPGDEACRHRNHRRDAHLMAEMMDALGLRGDTPVPLVPRTPEEAMAEAAHPRDWESLLSGVLKGSGNDGKNGRRVAALASSSAGATDRLRP